MVLGLVLGLSVTGGVGAVPISVGGVTWDPDGFGDFSASLSAWSTDVSAIGDTISGYGEIEKINGYATGPNQLTFSVTGVVVDGVTVGGDFTTTGGLVTFYSDASNNFDFMNPGTAMDGSVWLTAMLNDDLNGVALAVAGVPSAPVTGTLDVTGGIAAPYFDTNSISLSLADLKLDLIAQYIGNNPALEIHTAVGFHADGDLHYTRQAGGTLAGDTTNEVPTPQPLALLLLGIGLLALRHVSSA